MTEVTISSKYQLVVPKAAREALGLKAGQRMEVLVYDGRLELVPVRDLRDARGLLAGIDTDVPREADRV
jgi:AbrB family looped-hinge helix DNA binding protein